MAVLPDAEPAELFRRIWRTTPDLPGFAVVRFAAPPLSRALRAYLLKLADAFTDLSAAGGRPRFVAERLGRFDQQVTSRFHCDGAPAASLLLLGYEPTPVRSRLFVADPYRAAIAEGTTAAAFLTEHNPMFPAREARLGPYTTEVPLPADEAFVVAINNSELPFVPAAVNPLGVLHKAMILRPDPSAPRVINSVGLMWEAEPSRPAKSAAELAWFTDREDLD